MNTFGVYPGFIFSPSLELLYFILTISLIAVIDGLSLTECQQASDLDGEIDLSTCYNVTEYQAQRNYGFQIHVSLSEDYSLYFYVLL